MRFVIRVGDGLQVRHGVVRVSVARNMLNTYVVIVIRSDNEPRSILLRRFILSLQFRLHCTNVELVEIKNCDGITMGTNISYDTSLPSRGGYPSNGWGIEPSRERWTPIHPSNSWFQGDSHFIRDVFVMLCHFHEATPVHKKCI